MKRSNALSTLQNGSFPKGAFFVVISILLQVPLTYRTDNVSNVRLWLPKCCKIQQLIFMCNKLYLYSAFCIYIQQYAFSKLFSFNKNTCSTSTKNNFIQQQCLFNFNPNVLLSKDKRNVWKKEFWKFDGVLESLIALVLKWLPMLEELFWWYIAISVQFSTTTTPYLIRYLRWICTKKVRCLICQISIS